MSTKQQMLEVLDKLPDDASVDEAIERLYLWNKIELGLEQVTTGDVHSHDEMKKRFHVDSSCGSEFPACPTSNPHGVSGP